MRTNIVFSTLSREVVSLEKQRQLMYLHKLYKQTRDMEVLYASGYSFTSKPTLLLTAVKRILT